MRRPFHLLTVDVEDWPQSTLGYTLPIEERVVVITHALLDLLDEAGIWATFFVLEKVAEAYPTLAGEIAGAGHEVGTHGYSHESGEPMSPERFTKELHRSVELLRQQTGQPVRGHRAADFSISARSIHRLEHLAEAGLAYGSSIFPIRHPRYGVPGAWRTLHRIRRTLGRRLVELPLTTVCLRRAKRAPLPSSDFPAVESGYESAVGPVQAAAAPCGVLFHLRSRLLQ